MPIQQMLLGVGAATKTYVDDVFSTYLYTGTGSTRSINNGVDLGEGGLVWIKNRGDTKNHQLFDTERGTGKYLRSNADNAQTDNSSTLSAFNNNGFSVVDSMATNGSSNTYASWTFRKAPGFLDVVTYTGNGTSGRTINHSLGSVPGMIMVKQTNSAEDWVIYHRGTGNGNKLHLNTTGSAGATSSWNNATPTSTTITFSSSGGVNGNNDTYVAYIFAGGESTAATARSVDFDGNDKLDVPSSTDFDFGSGNFTVEAWVKTTASGEQGIVNRSNAHAGSDSAFIMYIQSSGTPYFGITENTGWDYSVTGTTNIVSGSWNHVAATREGNYLKMYVNGTLEGTTSWSGSIPTSSRVVNIGAQDTGIHITGSISNVRIVKGTAVYTSSFRPSYEPLTNITNTKLLCCQNSSVTGATVIPTGSISTSGDPTASTDSPFDDPAGFVFGDAGDQNLIKCGSYKTDGNEDATVDLGWEPQWLLVKRTDSTDNWMIVDAMRGFPNAQDIAANVGGQCIVLEANTTDQDDNTTRLGITPTGFYADQYGANREYVYCAIRRSDGYVGKPIELGTSVFAMDTGAGSSTMPNFDSGFPVDLAITRAPASTTNWETGGRLIQGKWIATNKADAQSSAAYFDFDSNTGWMSGASAYNSDYQAWMWKRHAGFDVVTYRGDGRSGHSIKHSLGTKSPEMIWIKRRDTSGNAGDWMVGHKGLNGGSSPWNEYLVLNKDQGEMSDNNPFNNVAPTTTAFQLSDWNRVNSDGSTYIAMLFSSVDGVSKVGEYNGTGASNHSITTGFQPRLIILKAAHRADGYGGGWNEFDTLRGINAGNEYPLRLNYDSPENSLNHQDYIDLDSDGFTIQSSALSFNGSNARYIYYAHA